VKVDKPDQNGFTLLEVMVATMIMAVGLTAVLTVFGASLRAMSVSSGHERARLEAERIMAELLLDLPKAPFSRDGRCSSPELGRWRASGDVAADNPTLTHLSVEVTFPVPGGSRSITLETAQANMHLPLQSGAEK
jgi:prepilin-type N-terminal cleavage/methylation domain-containing protein